jgi:lipoprotein-releasing system ATP-binding protein
MDHSEIILHAEHLNKHFREVEDFHVLKDVSLDIRKGEFVSIIGKSGSGKSTLLYLLSTLDTDYDGTITIRDTNVTGLDQNALSRFRNAHIGFVFQFHFLLPEFTVLENVILPALKLGKYTRAEIEKKGHETLDLLEMNGYADKLSSKLSGGQQQRVAIARALINDPDIVMADEPTGNLDSVNTDTVFHIFQRLSKERGQTVIAVTHDMDFAGRSDRRIELVDGRIVHN